MRYVYLLCFVYLSFLMIFSSCEKEDLGPAHNDACLDDNNAFEDMKAWYYFKQGTYWIYEEQNSGLRDTLIVYEDAVAQFDTIYQFEWRALSTLGDDYHQWVNTSWYYKCSVRPSCNCNLVFRSRSNQGEFIGEDRPFMFPHYQDNWILNLWAGGLSTIISIQDSTVISNESFFDVVEYDTEIDASRYNNHVISKYAKNVGLIQTKIPQLNQDWRLVEYAVVQ